MPVPLPFPLYFSFCLSLLSSLVLSFFNYVSVIELLIMARLRRGQPPARQTKVVHHEPGCLKAGSSCGGLGCRNDVTSSKPTSVGRDVAEALQSRVSKCSSTRCKTLYWCY